ncbi:general substrate transporter [Mycena olivaceomarginata]|nr:general substrate transporter [Mycena olivaceomarginata]
MALFYTQGVPIGWVAIMLALLASMGGFIFGYDTGQISDILLMDDFLLRFAECTSPGDVSTCAFSNVRAGLIVALLSIGTLFGALMGAPTADFLGRRYAMTVECGVFIIGVLVQILAFKSWVQFALGRLISGFAVGALSAAVPMKTAPHQIRGTLTATYQLFITFGILVAYCISIGARGIAGSGSWRTVVAIGILWPLILGIGILTMPESPRWLAKQHRLEEAEHSLARVRGLSKETGKTHAIIQRELEEIRLAVEREEKIKGGWIDCFKPANKTLYRTLLAHGANYFFYYGATIFKSVGISDSFVTQIILGAVNFLCTFLGLYIMEKFGRRMPLIFGGIWQSIWLFVFAAVGTAKDPSSNKGSGYLMIISACLFILGYASTWAPGIWILIGETFPTRTRAKQAALSTSSNWLWNFLLAFFTPFINNAISYRYGFAQAVVYFFLYESSDLTLETVDVMYNDPACKPWTSRQWAPLGYSSRREPDGSDETHLDDKDGLRNKAAKA